MWVLFLNELANRTAYKDQKVWFMRTLKASVKNVFVRGQKVQSAICTPSTKPIFRSESARYVLYVQMSKEMWDFDGSGSGEIMFSKVINGFLPELFKRWQQMNARHLVTVVLFTRMQYETDLGADSVSQACRPKINGGIGTNGGQHSDFYRVVVSDMSSGEWTDILARLKIEFKIFLRDITIRRPSLSLGGGLLGASDECPEWVISGQPCIAARGNILEAINLASSQFSYDRIDRDLVRTGVSVAVITSGTGLFEVDHQLLVTTTENLVAIGIGIDLICLARMPLHSIPLFKYKKPHIETRQPASEESWARDAAWLDSSSSKSTEFVSAELVPASLLENSTQSERGTNRGAKAAVWCYGVPHWIDVSFWTSPSEDSPRQPERLKRSTDGSPTLSLSRQRKAFRPRVRMYELQMLGVMEDAMNDISIPYLTPVPRIERSSPSFRATKRPPNQEPNLGEFGHLGSPTSSLTSSLWLSPSFKANAVPTSRQLNQYMTNYDEEVFRDLQIREPSKTVKPKLDRQHTRHSAESKYHRHKLKIPPGGHPSSPNEKREDLGSDSRPNDIIQLDGVKKPRQRRVPTKSVKNDADIRSSPISRQIRFGPRGFRVTAPKAIASTEVTAEHAKSESLWGQSLRMQLSKSTTAAASTTQDGTKFAPRPMSTHSVGSNKDRLEQSQSSDSDAQDSSRPIPIRRATAIRIPDDSGGAHSQDKHVPIESTYKRDQSLHSKSKREERDTDDRSTFREAGVDVPTHSQVLTPGTGMASWLTALNPSNPKADISLPSRLGRWQHVFPRPLRASKIKWKSLCSPAAVPISTEDFPSAEQLSEEYHKLSYLMNVPKEDELSERPRSGNWLLREMVSLRLSHGFQIVAGSQQSQQEKWDAFDKDLSVNDGAVLHELFKVGSFHRLRYIKDEAVQVTCFIRHSTTTLATGIGSNAGFIYKPAIRTMLAETYATQDIKIIPRREDFDWQEIDAFVAGHAKRQPNELAEGLPFWRARFVLIPVDPPINHRRSLQPPNEDNEEEIRLEGIRKLTQMWQRFRYIPPDERRFQAPARRRKDTNPLDIMYQTRNPSSIVSAEKGNMAENSATGKLVELLPESELFQRSNLNLGLLAQTIQGEKGVRMMDRRWHWRLHYNCFIGFEFTSWLLQNFRDIDSRDEAVELGNELMTTGLFQHVEQRHNFRDGNFFYQIASDYRAPRPEARAWFGTRKSVPPTPISEDAGKDFTNRPGSRASSNAGDNSEDDGLTPTADKQTLGVALSKSMLYDVDHRKKSYRPELIHLHYDRLHNPDNCYHIRIDWMNVTSKFIKDAIVSWAITVERFGLKLVQIPLAEACAITKMHPFRAPYSVVLARHPPSKQPEHQACLDVGSFSIPTGTEKHFYQKTLLKTFDYVLDFEAAKDFPPDVDVTYSWGKPDYKYPQYIHRSGVLLAQITDDGNFLLLANRLYNNRSRTGQEAATAGDSELHDRKTHGIRAAGHHGSPRASPFSSPTIQPTADVPLAHRSVPLATYATPEQLKNELESFCRDETALDAFYNDVLNKPPLAGRRTPYLESTIPTLGLPPSLSLRDGSPASGGSGSNTKAVENGSPGLTGLSHVTGS